MATSILDKHGRDPWSRPWRFARQFALSYEDHGRWHVFVGTEDACVDMAAEIVPPCRFAQIYPVLTETRGRLAADRGRARRSRDRSFTPICDMTTDEGLREAAERQDERFAPASEWPGLFGRARGRREAVER